MKQWDLIRSVIRRWPIVLVGALFTAALGYLAVDDRDVYWTRTEVVFLAPSSQLYPNSLKTTSEDLIITAGVVAKRVTGPGRITKYASPDANLVGIGIRDGWSIRLPDTGGQWATNFTSQALTVEVVGPDRETVLAKQQELIDRIEDELDALQRSAGVDPRNDITATVVPESAVVHQIGGSKLRTLGMIAALGAGATLGLVFFVEYRARRRASGAPPSDAPMSAETERPLTPVA